jgi:hypothetical protein
MYTQVTNVKDLTDSKFCENPACPARLLQLKKCVPVDIESSFLLSTDSKILTKYLKCLNKTIL